MTQTHKLVMGFDPGPHKTAAALIAVPQGAGIPIFVKWYHVPSNPKAIAALLEGHLLDLVVVERVYLWDGRTNNSIRDTCEISGAIGWMAEHRNIETIRYGVTEWRRRLVTGKKRTGTANDKMVELALRAHFPDLPKSNDHLRDALGIALVGSWSTRFK